MGSVLKILMIGLCVLMFSIIGISSVYAADDEYITIGTRYFNITFDKLHGGVVTSLQYKGVEFLTGPKEGVWGTIGLRRSIWDGIGDVCTRWPIDMYYQYDQNHTVTVSENDMEYVVTIRPNGTSRVLGEDGEIVWTIPKDLAVITVRYVPGYDNEYLYIPFIRDYNLSMGILTYYTVDGRRIIATPTPYCESRWYRSYLAQYELLREGLSVRAMILVHDFPFSYYSAYYGADPKTWQLHYPFDGVKPKEISMLFYD